ncbi:cytochrome P450 [Frankia sp. AgPm24]|uniref:cytochrome P450 n=1 Tax=Frankia sp. AgPm24 TaxID=631128 RepID=UPI00200E699E|nr:cytochrome P450 [Frankia sp. AgPm24]MCK9922446.1 cytochrome P450 [Frankia sp. AgPm24]
MDDTHAPSLLRLFDPEWDDPYEFYRELRESSSVQWDEWMRCWLVLGYEEIVLLSRDERLSGARIDSFYEQLPSATRAGLAPLKKALSDMMLFNEPPRHTRLRRLIRPGLTPRFVRDIRPLIEGVANDLLDRALPSGLLDVIGDFSEPLTREVIARLAGVGGGHIHLLENWQGLLHEFFTQSQEVIPRINDLRGAFDHGARARRDGTEDDLFSRMIAGQLDRADYTEDEIFANFLLLIDAGQATTTHLVGNAVLALCRHPEQMAMLRDDPDLAAGAAHEFMRFDSSVQFTSRVALDDIEIGGQLIERGESVALVLGAGNRDPRRYPDPDRLDIRRNAQDHLSFGHGIHYCLGAALAVAEIEIAITTLLRRTVDLRLAEAGQSWLESVNFRFLQRLPVVVTPVF